MMANALPGGDLRPRPVILLVEDHVDTRQMYAEFLRDDFDVLQAGDGVEALEMVRAHRPNLLVTDLSLPGLDGFELMTEIRRDPAFAHLPIICLSGYGGVAHDRRAREAGCTRVLQKPCMPDALSAALGELLRYEAGRGVSS
jgi:CheY-like chemotaxis protein